MSSGSLLKLRDLKDAAYFRRRAQRTRELGKRILQLDARKALVDLAREYEELADDLDQGVRHVRHAELLPEKTL